MPGFLIHLGATVMCAHGGQATPMSPNARVLVSGQTTVTLPTPYAVAGCTLPSSQGGPCVTAQFILGATRVSSNGLPLLLFDSRAVCAPTGTPLVVAISQTRVTGT